jgi:hypothetical protein
MLNHVISLQHHEKIAWIVVSLIAIFMMNDLTFRKRPSKHAFCDNPMLMPAVILSV